MVEIKNIKVIDKTITIETRNGCVIDYDIDAFKVKDALPATPPNKIEFTPSFDDFKKKHIHSITKTDSELVLNFEKYDKELHVCHDKLSVELYSVRRELKGTKKQNKKHERHISSQNCDSPSTPLTPYVIKVFPFS